jgi:hypothetical protein
MFAAFKTHDVMAGYISHKFENHPSVSTKYDKYRATNSGSEKVVKLQEPVEVVKGKANSALDEAKYYTTKKADVAASKYAELVKDIAVLTRCIKVMEDQKWQNEFLPISEAVTSRSQEITNLEFGSCSANSVLGGIPPSCEEPTSTLRPISAQFESAAELSTVTCPFPGTPLTK